MLNFSIKGKYKSEDELINVEQLPNETIQFNEGKTLQDAFGKGFLLGLPLMIDGI